MLEFNCKEKEFLSLNSPQINPNSGLVREATHVISQDHSSSNSPPISQSSSVEDLEKDSERRELENFAKSTLKCLAHRIEWLKNVQSQMKILQSQLQMQLNSLSQRQNKSKELSQGFDEASKMIELTNAKNLLHEIASKVDDTQHLTYNIPAFEQLVEQFCSLASSSMEENPQFQSSNSLFSQVRQKLFTIAWKLTVKSFEAAASGAGMKSAFDSGLILRSASALELEKRIGILKMLLFDEEDEKQPFNALWARYFSSRKFHLTEFACNEALKMHFLPLIRFIQKLWKEELETFVVLFGKTLPRHVEFAEFNRFFYESVILSTASQVQNVINSEETSISECHSVLFDEICSISNVEEEEQINESKGKNTNFLQKALMISIGEPIVEKTWKCWQKLVANSSNEPESLGNLIDSSLLLPKEREDKKIGNFINFLDIFHFFEKHQRERIVVQDILNFAIRFDQRLDVLEGVVEALKRKKFTSFPIRLNLELPLQRSVEFNSLDDVVSFVRYANSQTIDL